MDWHSFGLQCLQKQGQVLFVHKSSTMFTTDDHSFGSLLWSDTNKVSGYGKWLHYMLFNANKINYSSLTQLYFELLFTIMDFSIEVIILVMHCKCGHNLFSLLSFFTRTQFLDFQLTLWQEHFYACRKIYTVICQSSHSPDRAFYCDITDHVTVLTTLHLSNVQRCKPLPLPHLQ